MLQLSAFLKDRMFIEPHLIDIRFEREIEEILSSNKIEVELFKKKLLSVLEKNNIQEFQDVIIVLDTSYEYIQSKMIAEVIRNEFSKVKIYVCGHHPTAVPNDFIYKNSPFDYIIEGEIELTLLELLKSTRISTPTPQVILTSEYVELDSLPFPDYQLFLKKYPLKDHFNFELHMSKGCPFNCNFCRIVRYKSKLNPKKRIIRNFSFPVFRKTFDKMQELVLEYNKSIPKIGFTDETFNSAQISKKILNFIIDNNLQESFKFACQTRIEFIDQFSEIFNLIKKSKMIVGYGFETANKELLMEMNKTKEPTVYIKKMERIIKKYEDLNEPYFRINLVSGFPGENHESFQDTINFLELKADDENIQVSPNLFYNDPVTNVYNNMEYYEKKFGTKFLKEWWKLPSNSLFNAILPMPSINYSRKELIWDYKENYAKILPKFKYSEFKTNVNWKIFFNNCYKKIS